MKTSFMASVLWIATLALMAGGGYGLYQYISDYMQLRDRLGTQDSIVSMRPKNMPEKENWVSFKNNSENQRGLGTGVLASVVPGTPYRKPKETKPTDTKPVDKVEPKVVYKSYEQVKQEVVTAFAEQFSLVKNSLVSGSKLLAYGTLNVKVTITQNNKPVESYNAAVKIRVNDNLRDVLSQISEPNKKAPSARILSYCDATVIAIYRDAVEFSYLPHEADKLMESIDPNEKPDSARFTIILDDSQKGMTQDSLVEKVENTGKDKAEVSGGANTPRANGSGIKDDDLAEAQKNLQPAEKAEREPSYPPDQLESRQIDEKTYLIGANDMNKQTFDEAAQYISDSVGPDGKANGIKVSEKLPPDSRLARAGAQAGDRIISINGKALNSVGEVRKWVNEQKDAGVTVFRARFVRNGLEQERTFHTAKKE